MSAKNVLEQMRRSDGESMANTIPPTKRGRRNTARQRVYIFKDNRAPAPQPGSKPQHFEPELVARDHCCGIHGAARERKGIKKGTSSARRRLAKEILRMELEGMDVAQVERDATPRGGGV